MECSQEPSRPQRVSRVYLHYCTISTVSSRILKICWPRWPINFLLSSSDLKQGLFFWPLRVTELTVEMVQYTYHLKSWSSSPRTKYTPPIRKALLICIVFKVSYSYMRDDCNSDIVIGRTVCFLYFFWPCFHKTGAGHLFLQLLYAWWSDYHGNLQFHLHIPVSPFVEPHSSSN
jgi:5-methylcytosine-specific restriction endonuclease McrA